jgi:hypothetical protein
MPISNYTPTCKFNNTALKNKLYIFSRGNVQVVIDNGIAPYASATTVPQVYEVASVSLNEEVSLDERYQFSKKLNVVFEGYFPVLTEGGIFVVENGEGFWVINPDFDGTCQYLYTFRDKVEKTEYTYNFKGNYPIIPCTFHQISVRTLCKQYAVPTPGQLLLGLRTECGIGTNGRPIITQPLKRVDYNDESLSFVERYSGGTYETTTTFTLNLDNYKATWQYNLLEFAKNKYAISIERPGHGNILAGWQNEGNEPKYSIDSRNDSTSIDITLTSKGHRPIIADITRIREVSDRSWIFVEGANGHSAMVCTAPGTAMYTLKAEVDAFGNLTGKYMQKTGYDYSDWGIRLVDETFNDYATRPDSTCTDYCGWERYNIPTTLTFSYPYQTYHFQLEGNCDWRTVNKPTWLDVYPTSGQAGETVNITLSASGMTPGKGRMTILLNNVVPYVTTMTYDPSAIVNDPNRTVNAESQTIEFTLNITLDSVEIYAMSDGLTIEWVQPNKVLMTIPRNENTSSRIHRLSLLNNLNGMIAQIEVTQTGMIVKNVEDGYICDDGDKYTLYRIYKSFNDGTTWLPSDQTSIGSLIEADSPDCLGRLVKWEFNGLYICSEGYKYDAVLEYVSLDGGTTWTATGNIRLGDLYADQSVTCTPQNEEWRQTENKVCQADL